jgi:predicted nucleic acid-binding protein
MSADFLDSNVFIYLFDKTNASKRGLAGKLVEEALRSDSAAISFQVVQETLHIITRKLASPSSAAQAQEFLTKILKPLWRVMPSESLYRSALNIQARYRYGFYDSLIIAAALDAGCKRLLSEDLHHGQRIEGLRIENPFRASR